MSITNLTTAASKQHFHLSKKLELASNPNSRTFDITIFNLNCNYDCKLVN